MTITRSTFYFNEATDLVTFLRKNGWQPIYVDDGYERENFTPEDGTTDIANLLADMEEFFLYFRNGVGQTGAVKVLWQACPTDVGDHYSARIDNTPDWLANVNHVMKTWIDQVLGK